jgi:hypothetical protein
MICLFLYVSNAVAISNPVAIFTFNISMLFPLPHTTEQDLLLFIGKIFVSLLSDQFNEQ